MKEVYLQIQEKRALLQELYRFPRTKAVKDRIRAESRLLGELEHRLTRMLRPCVEASVINSTLSASPVSVSH